MDCGDRDVAVWTAQRIVTSCSCPLGSPVIAGPSDLVTKKSAPYQSEFLYLHERVMTPNYLMMVPLYALSMVCFFSCRTFSLVSVGVQFFSGTFGGTYGVGECFPVLLFRP